MDLLVVGASGFIGRNLLQRVPASWRVVATYHQSTDFVEFLQNRRLRQVHALAVDLTGEDAGARVAAVSSEFERCIFLAGNSDPARSVEHPRLDLSVGTGMLIELLQHVRVGSFVYVSSGAVYDGLRGFVSPESSVRPTLPYGISKLASEHYVRHFAQRGHIKTGVNVRFFGAFGPHEPARKIYTRLVRQFAQGRDPRFTVRGDGRNLIDAMYVDDAVRAFLMILQEPGDSPYATLDLSCGRPLTIIDLVKTAATVFGLDPQIQCCGEVPEYIEFRSNDRSMADRYGFAPDIPLEDGLRRLAAHLTGPSASPR